MIYFKLKRIFQLCFVALFCFNHVTTARDVSHEDQMVLGSSIDLRVGPGVFYEWSGRLFEGTVLQIHEREDGWIRVTSGQYQGWIPDYPELFNESEKPPDNDDFEERRHNIYSIFGNEDFNSNSSDGFASPTQVAAAVRGFSRQYNIQRARGPVDETELYSSIKINPEDYRNFKRERIGRWNRNMAQRRFAISSSDVPLFDHNQESIGWAVAKRLASEGIIQNHEFQTYLNLLGMMVTESSHRYEMPVSIFLLDQESISGYSTPAGIIFIAKGSIDFMQSEAELVFFIAHELAHIQFMHGNREIQERNVHIRRDEAFRELRMFLEEETENSEYGRVSEELSAWADQVYEYLVSERLNEYEYEADYWALVYMYRLGYDLESALHFLRRILIAEGDFDREIGTLEWEGTALESRIARMSKVFEQFPDFSTQGIINREVYQNKKGALEQ